MAVRVLITVRKTRRLRRLAILTGGLLVGSVMYALPASAAPCNATVQAFSMAGGVLNTCANSELVKVTGSGTLTFNLAGGDFELANGDPIVFELNLTDGTSDLVVNGGSDRDAVDLGTDGVNLNGTGDPEVVSTGTNTFEAQFDSYTVTGGAEGDDLEAAGRSRTGDPMTEGVTINGGPGNDTIDGGAGADTLNGDTGNDRIDGGEGNDVENGGDGRDTFTQDDHSNGGDTIVGGNGSDKVDYSFRTTSVSVTLDGDANDGEATYAAGPPPTWVSTELDDVSEVERMDGGESHDELDASTSTSRTVLDGDEGDDVLTGGSNNDRLSGDDGNDTLNGGAGRDRLDGGEGNDVENGDADRDFFAQDREINGNDDLNGGTGKDTVSYSSRDNAVTVTVNASGTGDGEATESDDLQGIEKVKGGSANDDLTAGDIPGSSLLGGGGADTLNGGSENDKLYGGSGNDVIKGNAGNDKMFGGSGDDNLDGGPGTDVANGGTGSDTCTNSETEKSC